MGEDIEDREVGEALWKCVEDIAKRYCSNGAECLILAVEKENVLTWTSEAGNQFLKKNSKWPTQFQKFCTKYRATHEVLVEQENGGKGDGKLSTESDEAQEEEDVEMYTPAEDEDTDDYDVEEKLTRSKNRSRSSTTKRKNNKTKPSKPITKKGRMSEIIVDLGNNTTMTRQRVKNLKINSEELAKKLPQAKVRLENLSVAVVEKGKIGDEPKIPEPKMRKDGSGRKLTGLKSSDSHWSSNPDLKPLWDYLYNRRYVCNVCGDDYASATKYFNHVRSHKDHQTCKVCDELVPKGADEMKKHAESAHPDGLQYTCLGCDRKFKSKLGLKNHYIGTHAPRNARFICKICQTTYGDKVQLDRHIKTHEYEHPCFICLKKIKTLEELKVHMMTAHCLHFCITCSAYFVDPVVLKDHEQTHKNSTSCQDVLDSYTTSMNDPSSATSGAGNDGTESSVISNDVGRDALQSGNGNGNLAESYVRVDESSLGQSESSQVNDKESESTSSSELGLKLEENAVAAKTEQIGERDQASENEKAAVIGSIKGNRDRKTCKFCGRQYKHGIAFLNHLKLHNNKSNFTCEHCGKVCKTDETYKRHIILHLPDEEKPFHCDICNKGFQTRTNLNKHLVVHNEPNALLCEICGKGHKDPRMLKIHMRKHTGEKPYKCDICNNTFRSRENLANHKVTHLSRNNPAVICDVCGKTFSHKLRLNAHKKRHNPSDNVPCPLCDKSFKTTYNLQLHCVSMHVDYAKSRGWHMHTCDFCGKSLATKERYNNHIRTHTGEKPHHCNYCGKSFAESSNLKSHIRIHTNDKPHICHVCNKSFIHKRTLKKHLQSHNINTEEIEKQESKPTLEPARQEQPPSSEIRNLTVPKKPPFDLHRAQNFTNDELLAISIVTGNDNFMMQNSAPPPSALIGDQSHVPVVVRDSGSDYLELKDAVRRYPPDSVQDRNPVSVAMPTPLMGPPREHHEDLWNSNKYRIMYN